MAWRHRSTAGRRDRTAQIEVVLHRSEFGHRRLVPAVAVVLDVDGPFRASYRSPRDPGHAQSSHHLVIGI